MVDYKTLVFQLLSYLGEYYQHYYHHHYDDHENAPESPPSRRAFIPTVFDRFPKFKKYYID